ncbi:putative transcription factor C2H2 family [Helianthus annuus]|uniref:Transcription factor C2H2 family n=1 Tax=Helianthus annuus TaxID=4232 RepID=A0A9K3JJ11_HELAN|nr:putative transcription factor C2H2 family [Helianthus annuus]KAJ0603047.1 putative transcription factor C2H2 family [Helianthus annuus]KAJ0609809.1 putative transcription factor C2H2 family [Helianthus annuus]KAJ0629525.1 putative transcription factor C2H2 family [Helianthus annuus]KAJ0945759.1 putative transcription factor C2H2 family [Helianthus annuus]
MAEVMNMPVDAVEGGSNLDRKDDGDVNGTGTATGDVEDNNNSIPNEHPDASPPPPPPPSRRHDRDSRERRNDDRDIDRPPNRRSDYYEHRNRSPTGPPHRDYKRRAASPNSPPYRDRRGGHSPPPRRTSPFPPYKRSRRDDGGYDGRRGSPRGGFGSGDRRFGYDYPGGYDRDMGGRPGFPDDRPRGRYGGRGYQGGPSDWESARGGYNDQVNNHREGLMSYKQFIQELEDDVLPSEAEQRYQEYKSEYISTQKRAYFDAHKGEDWLKDKYHPTNLLAVIERRNEAARKLAKEFLHDLQNGSLDLGPGVTASSANKSGRTSNPASEDESDLGGKKRRHGRISKETDSFSAAPKAHPISSEHRRIQADVEQAQALVKKLDFEKGIEDNILSRADNERSHRDKSHSGSSGPVVIIRGSTSVKGLEGVELLDTLLTYLYRVHGLDYYGLSEKSEPKGFRHVRADSKNSDVKINGSEWEKKLDTRWQERLKGQDPLEIMTAKEKIDAAAAESLDPYVRKIRDEKYGWKYGCGAKGCTKLFHAAEFVHKHLKLKHPELAIEVTSKVREDLYFQNYMNDEDAPGGIPIMQTSLLVGKDRPQRHRPGIANRLKDNRREHDGRINNGERFDRGENPENDGGGEGHPDDQMFDSFGGQSLHTPFPADIPPPPVLMPVPGAGPLGPFVPAPPEVAMRMLRDQGGPPPFEGGGRNGRSGPQISGPAPIIALPPSFRQDPRRLRSYQDLDAPEDEVTVIDYRSL